MVRMSTLPTWGRERDHPRTKEGGEVVSRGEEGEGEGCHLARTRAFLVHSLCCVYVARCRAWGWFRGRHWAILVGRSEVKM
jgi:hypothetical protein